MNARKLKKKSTLFIFQKSSIFEFQRKDKIALKLFEFIEQFMMESFLVKLKLTQFAKTGSIGKTFISLENLIINFLFRN